MIRPKYIRPIGILLTQLGPIQANYEGPGILVIQLYDVDKGWWLRKIQLTWPEGLNKTWR